MEKRQSINPRQIPLLGWVIYKKDELPPEKTSRSYSIYGRATTINYLKTLNALKDEKS